MGSKLDPEAASSSAAGRTGAEVGAAARAAEVKDEVEFHALRNALYHTARRIWLERCDAAMKLASILFATGAVATMTPDWGAFTPAALALVAAAFSAGDLVLGFGRAAFEHAILQRRYYDVLADLEETDDPAAVRRARAAMTRLYGEERPVMRAVDAIAYNAAQTSRYGDRGKRLKVAWHHGLLRHVWPYSGSSFDETGARAAV
jgi:hypothetical protein